MENCINCKPIQNEFDTVGKTYYVLYDGSVMCYRHWYQAGSPHYKMVADYASLFSKYGIKSFVKKSVNEKL
jgi:hypothetical protein